MKAYLDIINTAEPDQPLAWQVNVVTEQDYHDGGPFACSHRVEGSHSILLALESATEWAGANGLTLVNVEDIA